MTVLDRVPPHDKEAEQQVLGSILLLPSSLDSIESLLRPEDFYDDGHVCLFRQMRALWREKHVVDATLLCDRLNQASQLARVGGVVYLCKLVEGVATAAYVVHYAEIVRRKSDMRRMIHAATDLLRNVYSEEQTVDELLVSHERAVYDIRTRSETAKLSTLPEVATALVDKVQSDMSRNDKLEHGVQVGIRDVDEVLGAVAPTEMMVLAARPGVGKTSLALQMARHVARRHGHVLFASLEMRDQELVQRTLCGLTGVPAAMVRRREVTAGDLQQLRDGIADLNQPVTILSGRRPTVGGLSAICRRLAAEHGRLAMVVVDYIGKLTPDNLRMQRHEQVSQISNDLKDMAMQMEVPVLVLCQLKREDGIPTLASLRESSSIEQDADQVAFLYQDQKPQPKRRGVAAIPPVVPIADDGSRPMTLEVAKNRHGGTGRVELRWFPQETRFASNGF